MKSHRKFKTSICSLIVLLSAQLAYSQTVNREKFRIKIGPTVQVSKAVSQVSHYENLSAADPYHPENMTSCSMVYPRLAGKVCLQYCYSSFDNGKTWEPNLKVDEGRVNGDPTVVYGKNNTVYAVSLVLKEPDKPRDGNSDLDGDLPYAAEESNFDPDEMAPGGAKEKETVVFKSTDAGRTWNEASRFQFTDREYISVDNTNGPYAGRIYILGQWGEKEITGAGGRGVIQMFRSLDGGKTFQGPVNGLYPEGTGPCGVGTSAILSDGTVAVIFGLVKKGRYQSLEVDPIAGPNGEMRVITSTDGGETFNNSVKITDWTVDRGRSEGGQIGELAVDPGSPLFKDRLYAVFPAIVSGRIQIELSYSSDKGARWSKPVVVNDDRSPDTPNKGPDHLLPSVAVNKDGVVLVTWYDRRDAKDNLGWQVRCAASLDGGETFSASVPVTPYVDSPEAHSIDLSARGVSDANGPLSVGVGIDSFYVSGGHTSGLAVDAAGIFHPTWVDNHTGITQLWTAPVSIEGAVAKHGGSGLASLDDVSGLVGLQLSNWSFNATDGTLKMSAQIKNLSRDTIKGPLKIRVLTLESALGVPEVTNADNNEKGAGATWDFTAELPRDGLTSMRVSAPKVLTFRISEMRPMGQGRDLKWLMVYFDSMVLGHKVVTEKGTKPDDKNSSGENNR